MVSDTHANALIPAMTVAVPVPIMAVTIVILRFLNQRLCRHDLI